MHHRRVAGTSATAPVLVSGANIAAAVIVAAMSKSAVPQRNTGRLAEIPA
jgi:hypothetical protein